MTISRPSGQELFVALAVLLFHFLLSVFLVGALNREESNKVAQEALIIHWIKRAPTVKAPPAVKSNSSVRRQTHQDPPDKKEAILVSATPDNQNNALEPRQLVLAAPESTISFERDPLAKKELLEATPTRMKVTIIDRSFFGMLQRMTKAQICKELRSALAKTTGDATTILQTMGREGCLRS